MKNLPQRPVQREGEHWTRFVCISDTHSEDFVVPEGDILLHAGDLTSFGRVVELQTTMSWLCQLPHPVKIIIAGNHDFTLDMDWYESNYGGFHRKRENPLAARDLVRGDLARGANLIYLEYQSAHVAPPGHHTDNEPVAEGEEKNPPKLWKFYGSPGSPEFGGWAFNYERGTVAEELHSSIPPETEVLLTHGPPHRILDTVHNGENAGCEELVSRLRAIRPRLHVFGHIHEAHGAYIHTWNDQTDGPLDADACGARETIFVNAANQPAGRLAQEALNDGHSPNFGGYNFQPVIVDLLDTVPPEPQVPPVPSLGDDTTGTVQA
ncbi:hypothetical protein BS47DRAFT_1321799 [Hydnum rufescens UP504]|uniref:Calcineurin-like phosphoesterase domain-containing protein n=1 Tax=Hydnum rufescens UP504 TaxID=1448309 RepID=A0A9P6AIK9_9AGAM|nr:hypothetical protein BS47DRAFT_1321799 [Hydnum rufescens UP504]